MYCNIAPLPGKSEQLGYTVEKRKGEDLKTKMQQQKVSLSDEKSRKTAKSSHYSVAKTPE